jgi:hypothetical protein
MSAAPLEAIRDVIQEDVNNRGLRTDPAANLVNACPHDFRRACESVAAAERPAVAIVTGFFIPHATPPCGETDGPLGAVFLARALVPLGVRVAIVTDAFCRLPVEVGLAACGLSTSVTVLMLPGPDRPWPTFLQAGWLTFVRTTFRMTHLVALERVGPSHTLASLHAQLGPEGALGESYLDFLHEVPEEHQDRCHTMRGIDITERMAPAHLLFESVKQHAPHVVTIGIGDGGNEIGMGKVSWETIRRNIPGGGLVACRVPTDHLIVAGVSNWGAYGLAAGVRLLRGARPDAALFDPERERAILERMVREGPLVDGMMGKQTATVDGLPFERYAEQLRRLGELR